VEINSATGGDVEPLFFGVLEGTLTHDIRPGQQSRMGCGNSCFTNDRVHLEPIRQMVMLWRGGADLAEPNPFKSAVHGDANHHRC
jgi:hypothetical protein